MTPPGGTGESAHRPQDESGHPIPTRARGASRAASLVELRRFRLRVALALAAISLISAYVSFIAGQRDATADDLDARASQQWAEEQQAEQQIDAMIAQDQRTTAHLDEDSQRFQSELRSADEIRSTDPDRAAMLDFASQATVDRFIQNWAFLRASPASVTKDGWTYDVEAARGLTRANDWRLFRESSDSTRHQADQAADRTASTVLIVVILVLGLSY